MLSILIPPEFSHSKDGDVVAPRVWGLYLKIDIKKIKPEVIQWALFEENPEEIYRENIMKSQAGYKAMLENEKDEREKEKKITYQMQYSWNKIFEKVSGFKTYVLTRNDKGPQMGSNEPNAKYWLATKTVNKENKPICWCIPFEANLGDTIRIALKEENAYNLETVYKEAMEATIQQKFVDVSPAKIEADTNFKNEPEAQAIYEKMLQTIQNANTMYYESALYLISGNYERECTLLVWLKKPNYARVEYKREGKITGILVGDGENFWIYWPKGRPYIGGENPNEYSLTRTNSYMRLNAPPGRHSIWHQLTYLGSILSVFQPSKFHRCPESLDEYLDGVRILDTVIVNNEECIVIEVSYMKNQRSKCYWISNNDFLPKKMLEITRVSKTLITFETWTNTRLNLEIADEKFTWKPPQGWKEFVLPALEEGLLKPGTEAPDFECSTIDGKKIRLSDYRGKVVWLVFWRVGCPPCREEIPYLQKLYEKYQDKGLVVIGFNVADDKNIIADLLKTHNVTFPNILEANEYGWKIYNNKYNTLKGFSAVPLNYIIDRDGKVVNAWYGYDKDDTETKEILKKLGFNSSP